MKCIVLDSETDFEHWREIVRPLLAARLQPEGLGWRVGDQGTDLFSGLSRESEYDLARLPRHPVRIRKPVLELCRRVLCHRAPERLFHLYALLHRLQDDPHALDDPLFVSALWVQEADKAVRRDIHKMHAFVRFRKVGERNVESAMREIFCAWFEPEHRIVAYTADFFVRRFTGMDWSILTPEGCSHWDGETLTFTPGVDRSHAPMWDEMDDAWREYYASIFNPSRVKIGAMMAEMPRKYWKNLPEAEIIPQLLRQSETRQSQFMTARGTIPNIRTSKVAPRVFSQTETSAKISTLEEAQAVAQRCTACPLHSCATQTVFGEGPPDARLMIVGEQPGDREDIAGRPFIGPAGQLLERALNEAGLDRGGLYVTNAVKHFKFEAKGKRRWHRNPSADEIERCRSWLTLERQFIRPDVIVALGRTALRSLTGHTGTLKSVRGQRLQGEFGECIIPTLHPSYLLRLPEAHRHQAEYRTFVADLCRARELMTGDVRTAI